MLCDAGAGRGDIERRGHILARRSARRPAFTVVHPDEGKWDDDDARTTNANGGSGDASGVEDEEEKDRFADAW